MRNDSSHVFRLHSAEVKLLAHAVSEEVFCSNMSSVAPVIQCTKHFGEASGVAVNLERHLGLHMSIGIRFSRGFTGAANQGLPEDPSSEPCELKYVLVWCYGETC